MLHIITENNELRDRTFPIPDGVRRLLNKTLKNYTGSKTIEGYKRLNNLVNSDSITYLDMKRIKNFFDNYTGTPYSAEFILNGGDAMKTWVNNTLNTATKAVHDFKQAKKDAGFNNAFKKPHEKDRQNKKKNKPTQTKFNTDNLSDKLSSNTDITFQENIQNNNKKYLTEDILDYSSEYDCLYVLNQFANNKTGKQDWGVLINPSMYQKALTEYTQTGKLERFPTHYVYTWIGIIMRNACILESNTILAGHTSSYPYEDIEMFVSENYPNYIDMEDDVLVFSATKDEFLSACNKNNIHESQGIHSDGQYDLFMNQEEVDDYDVKRAELDRQTQFDDIKDLIEKYNDKYHFPRDEYSIDENYQLVRKIDISDFLNSIGLFDWMTMPDGSDAISDYGLKPLFQILNEYDDNTSSPEETLVLINRALDVSHQRGDLSSIFITGGTPTLSQLSNGGYWTENKQNKIITITEKQHKKLMKEAMKDSFSFEELSKLPSFNARYKYCTEHLGQHVGKGSSRVTFQIDDEKVLKLAYNNKGMAQNDAENSTDYWGVFPEIFQTDPNGLWLVSEYVLPAKAQDFKHCFGLTFNEFSDFIRKSATNHSGRGRNYYNSMSEEQYEELLNNYEDLYNFDCYIGDTGAQGIGDMTRICNYGLTQRNGLPTIVLLDSGLNDDVWNTYYKR